MTQSARQGLGAAGERAARSYLERLGYEFVGANWRCPRGELDLVMRDGAVLVIVEVKTRHGERLGAAEEGVSAAQASRLLQTAEEFLAAHPSLADVLWRVDLVAITLAPSGAVARMTHLVDAIQA